MRKPSKLASYEAKNVQINDLLLEVSALDLFLTFTSLLSEEIKF